MFGILFLIKIRTDCVAGCANGKKLIRSHENECECPNSFFLLVIMVSCFVDIFSFVKVFFYLQLKQKYADMKN
jgi:hypothetical protein